MRLLIIGALLLAFGASPALARARPTPSMAPQNLEHYSFCVSQAKDRNFVFLFDRGTMFRCHGDVAASYWNYLGRQNAPESRVNLIGGVYLYRIVSGVGRCWNQILDVYGAPVSYFGCDLYVDL